MKNSDMESIFNQVAKLHNTTAENVRKEIAAAMNAAMNNPDPSVKQKWESIPKSGECLTPEEFVAFVACIVNQLAQP